MYKFFKKNIVWLFIIFLLSINIDYTFAVRDIMDIMFHPAKSYEKIVDLGTTKNAVWNEVFRESTQFWVNENLWNWCFVNKQHITNKTIEQQMVDIGFDWDSRVFCEEVLWGDYDTTVVWIQKQAPLIVRITKFLLRLTIILSITMVLYNWIFWVIEASKWWDVKDAQKNIIYIVGWILLALSSVALINLISSITLSSLVW